jgi:dehydrogenase/reductase SDR family member 12
MTRMTRTPGDLDLNNVDRILDRTVALGYGWPGYVARRRWWPEDPAPASLVDKRVLITGATSGIGRAAAARGAELGATVHLLGHNTTRATDALQSLTAQVPAGRFELELCDLQSLPDVRRFATDFAAQHDALDALAHNAGVYSEHRQETPEGHERTYGVHVLAPHLLNHALTPLLSRAASPRVVVMSSGGMYAQRLTDDVEFRDDSYSGTAAYARTKRMQVVLAHMWSHRLADEGVAVHAMHPGWVDTPGVRTYLSTFRTLTRPVIRTPEQGADTLVWLLATRRTTPWSGAFWHDRAPRPVHYWRRTTETRADRDRFMARCDDDVASFLEPSPRSSRQDGYAIRARQ